MSTIVWLDDAGAGELALVGGKAANLSELVRAGFEVPPGFVVTTDAYHQRNPDGSVPATLADAIGEAWQALVGKTGSGVAVRSSATAEDLAEASFAGQQETFLGVRGEAAVVAAVADCWASLHSERAIAYRREHDVDETGLGIGVVVQVMVPATAAGVMFTANPVNGHTEQVVITAAWGLGESVVAGLVDPDTVVVDTDGRSIVARDTGNKALRVVAGDQGTRTEQLPADRRTDTVLDDSRALELADLGRRVEAHFGRPQDIEWALATDGFHLLQSRPITVLADRVDDVPDDWPSEPHNMYFRASITEQMPTPLTPLFADLVAEAVPKSLSALMLELVRNYTRRKDPGPMDVGFPTINGYAFYRYSNKAMRQYTSISLPALRHLYGKGGQEFIGRWRDLGLPAYREVVARWKAIDPGSLASQALLDGVAELLLAGCTYYTHVQTIIPLAGTAELAWAGMHKTFLGAKRVSAEQYLLGYDSAPLLAEKALWDLGQWVLSDAGLAAALGDVSTDALQVEAPAGVLTDVWAQWRSRFAEYLGAYGHTVYDLDFIHPTPADDPAPILQGLRFVLGGQAVDPYARQARLAETRERITGELLGSLDPARRAAARRTLRWAQRIVPVREDALAAMGLAWPTMRTVLKELGRRLVASGALVSPDDIYWLTRGELAELVGLRQAQPTSPETLPEPVEGSQELAARIAERQALHRGQERLRPPQALPKSRLMSLWDSFLPGRVDGAAGDVLKGNAGSGGVVTGPARVISGPSDFADFSPGEILVAEITTPAYTPLFAVAGGIVTDIGGVLSHGSIVAREYGIPAVLGTGSATSRIHTGDVVRVDGDRGEVRLEPAPAGVSAR